MRGEVERRPEGTEGGFTAQVDHSRTSSFSAPPLRHGYRHVTRVCVCVCVQALSQALERSGTCHSELEKLKEEAQAQKRLRDGSLAGECDFLLWVGTAGELCASHENMFNLEPKRFFSLSLWGTL